MSSPFPGLKWTVSTGQTGLDTSAETAVSEKAAPPTSSAAAAALLDETMPFMSLSLKKVPTYRQDNLDARSREESCERASRFYAAVCRKQRELNRYRANWIGTFLHFIAK